MYKCDTGTCVLVYLLGWAIINIKYQKGQTITDLLVYYSKTVYNRNKRNVKSLCPSHVMPASPMLTRLFCPLAADWLKQCFSLLFYADYTFKHHTVWITCDWLNEHRITAHWSFLNHTWHLIKLGLFFRETTIHITKKWLPIPYELSAHFFCSCAGLDTDV